ncbi:MAG: N-acetylmuramoyl-L-alanine amidase [Candidatus Omnitrophica bacterium]|nr:N-acetylmuramoyl-L-alanine amidase [Candidatus Omnitrophota bacterium]
MTSLIARCVAGAAIILIVCVMPLYTIKEPVSVMVPRISVEGPVVRQEVEHTVMPGETLFRLSKMYDVKVDDIMLRNQLSTKTLTMGQKIVIPGAASLNDVIPLFPSKKWKYIIIHHSATEEDNALSLYALHQRRGWDSTGYDFLIDNGAKGTVAGHVDATPRWIAQKDGAHCKASGMNTKAIGVCLIGNFSLGEVPEVQLMALVRLVKYLKEYYDIPATNIMGHGQVPEANTECPGKLFPWQKFHEMLAAETASDLEY